MVGDRGQERYRQRGCSSVTKVNLIHDLKSSHRWPPRGLTGRGGMELSGPNLKGLESHRGVHLSKLIDGSSSFRVLTMKPLGQWNRDCGLVSSGRPTWAMSCDPRADSMQAGSLSTPRHRSGRGHPSAQGPPAHCLLGQRWHGVGPGRWKESSRDLRELL